MRIPYSWEDITVGQYEKLYKTFHKEYLNPVDKIHEQIVILTGLSQREAWNLETRDVVRFKAATDFINKPIPVYGKFHKRFKAGDNYYEFQTDAQRINGGQYMSAMDLQTDAHRVNENLHIALFNIAKPIKKRLGRFKEVKIDDWDTYYEDRINDFKEIPMSLAYPVVVFFSHLSRNLTGLILDYSAKELKKMRENVDRELETLTHGSEP